MSKETRKTISAIIGSKLKELRKSKELSIEELASRTDVSKSMISYIESAKRLPSVRVIKIYARFFDVDELELLDLREATIFETVAMLGEDAPLAIRNERNMIAHSYKRESRMNGHLKEKSATYDTVVSLEDTTKKKAAVRSQRALEKAKIARSIYEIDELEVTDEEFEIAVEAVRAFRLRNRSSFD